MKVMDRTDAAPCVPGALPGGLSRTRFFDGMFLTQRDMEREQRYWQMKRRLTNRALGRVPQGGVGVTDLEEVVARVLHTVLHRELDIDDVLVAGQHQRLVAYRLTTGLAAKPDLGEVRAGLRSRSQGSDPGFRRLPLAGDLLRRRLGRDALPHLH